MRKQVIFVAMTATAAQAWVPMPSFSGLTRGFASDVASTPVRCVLVSSRQDEMHWDENTACTNHTCGCYGQIGGRFSSDYLRKHCNGSAF